MAIPKSKIAVLAQAFIVTATVWLTSTAQAGEFVTPSGVVELFTSQGCRSCPPADRAFEKVVKQGDVVALSYHVDYWNYLGWADTLARPENTERQYAYAKAFGRSGVYTPQAIINGLEHIKGTDTAEINGRIRSLKNEGHGLRVPVNATRKDDQLSISIGAGAGKADVIVVYFRQHQTVELEKGENAGQTLDYWHSVTDIQTVGMWRGEPISLALPAKIMGSDKSDGCAILLQSVDDEGNPTAIIGAAMMMKKRTIR